MAYCYWYGWGIFPLMKADVEYSLLPAGSWGQLETPWISALIWKDFSTNLEICKQWILDEDVTVVDKSHTEDIKTSAVNCSLWWALLLQFLSVREEQNLTVQPKAEYAPCPQINHPHRSESAFGHNTAPVPLLRQLCWGCSPVVGVGWGKIHSVLRCPGLGIPTAPV